VPVLDHLIILGGTGAPVLGGAVVVVMLGGGGAPVCHCKMGPGLVLEGG